MDEIFKRNLRAILDEHLKAPQSTIDMIVKETDTAIFNRSLASGEEANCILHWTNPRFGNIYQYLATEFLRALDPNSSVGSRYLIDLFSDPALTRKDVRLIAKSSVHKFAPQVTDSIYNRIEYQTQQVVEEVTSDMYPCPNCKARKATYRVKQLRSADEGETVIIRCQECSHVWYQ